MCFRIAIQIKSTLADRKAKGEDPKLFADGVIKKAKLLMDVGFKTEEGATIEAALERQISLQRQPSFSLKRAGSISAGGASAPTEPPKKRSKFWVRTRIYVKLLTRYIGAVSNLKRLMVASNKLAAQSSTGQLAEVSELGTVVLRFMEVRWPSFVC